MSEASILQEVIEFRDESAEAWDPILEEAKLDMKFVSGDPWDEKDKKAREDAGRQCLTLDELNQYFNQGINDLRANPLGMKFSPRGNGATKKGAEFYQNKAREIEYRSRAQVAYITAAENMFQQGIGWCRLNTKFKDVRSWNQDIWIEPVMNPTQVLPDPNSIWPDSRDTSRLIYIETRSISQFKREFKGAKVQDFGREAKAKASAWLREGKIDVGEFWKKVPFTRRLLMLTPKGRPNGPIRSVFLDELPDKKVPEGWIVRREEDREDTKVVQYLTNGLEILKTRDWAGKDIPFVSFFGKVLYVNGKRVILSQTRLARDPYMAYCFYRTCEMEIVGLTTKNPYWAYEDQLSPDMMEEIAKSLHEPVAVLLAKHSVPGLGPNQVLPLPTRNQFSADIAAYSMGAEEMRRAIQAAMGISPMPTSMQKDNQKSGKAVEKMEASMQKGSFHFVDHYQGGITRVAELCENLIDKIHDTAADEWVRQQDGTSTQVRINDPSDPESIDVKGDYEPTVSAGPSFDDERAAGEAFVDSIIGNLKTIAELRGPQVASAILAKSIKLKALGPIGDQIADLIEPPEYREKDGKPPNPEVLAAQAQVKQLQQALQQAGMVIKTKQVEGKQKFEIEQMKVEATSADKAKDREVKIAVAALTAKIDRLALFLEESRLVGVRQHEATESHRDRAHASIERVKDRLHERITQGADHDHASEQSEADAEAAAEADAGGGAEATE